MFSHLVQYVLLGAVRDRLIQSMFAVLAVCISLSIFFGSSSLIEKQQFTLVFASGSLRLASVVGLILFIVFFIRRSFENKDVEFLLSRPLSRLQLISAYAVAFSIIGLFLAILSGILIIMIAPDLLSQGHYLWILSVCAENIIMVNVALFFAMVLTSSAAASMAALGFYILARMMGQILGIIDANITDTTTELLEYVMQGISVFMPRLDLMGQTSWLIYDVDGSIGAGFILLQCVIFTLLILSACFIDISKRQF